MPDFRRKPNRLPAPTYTGPRSYFVTLCLQERRQLFTYPDVVQPLIALLRELARARGFDVYAYCFMPDHCHALLCGLHADSDLSALIRTFKGQASAVLRKQGWHNVWQQRFHDHVIRNDDDVRASAVYILENPVRAGLIKDPHDWPFSGSFVFEWHPTQL